MAPFLRTKPAGPASILVLLSATLTSNAEISPMTRQRLPQAEQLGRDAVMNDDPVIYMEMCRTRTPHAPHAFDVTITTPFTAMAYVVYDSVKAGKAVDLAQWSIDTPGKQSVMVAVDPAGLRPGVPAGVANVVLRRGARIIEPTRSDVRQVRISSPDKERGEFRGGTFYFPIGAFASEEGELEIVIIPQTDEVGAEAVVKLSKGQLSRMR